MKQRRERLARGANALGAVVLLGWILYGATGTNLFGRRPWRDRVVDYRGLYGRSRQVVHEGRYVLPPFPYAPPAVILVYATTAPPFPVAAGIWMAVTVLATVGTLVLGTSLVGLRGHPWRWCAALAAFALTNHYIQWDLRSQNCNMVYLFLLVAALAALKRRRDVLAGALLAGSITLKLYPVLVPLYLWWIGRRRASVAAVGFLAAFFVVLPVLVFGPGGAVRTYASWIDHLRLTAATVNESDHPILIALPFTLTKDLGADSLLVPWLVRAAWVAWLGAAAACVLAGRPWKSYPAHGWNLAVDGGVLTLAPIVISPYLESYHVVPALLPILALVQRTTDPACTRMLRAAAVVAMAAGWLALKASAEIGHRGAGVLVQMVLAALALAAIRWKQPHRPSPPGVCLE